MVLGPVGSNEAAFNAFVSRQLADATAAIDFWWQAWPAALHIAAAWQGANHYRVVRDDFPPNQGRMRWHIIFVAAAIHMDIAGSKRSHAFVGDLWKLTMANFMVDKTFWDPQTAFSHVTVTNASAPSCLVKRAQGVDSLGIMCVPTNIMAPPQNAHAADDTVEATSDASCRVQVHFHCRIVPSHTHPRCQRATAKMSPWLCLATIVIEWIAQTNYRQARLKSGRANCCPGKMAFSLQDISSEGSGLHHSVPWLV